MATGAARAGGAAAAAGHNPVMATDPARGYARIYAVVGRIPRGRVATYGQVARLAGIPGHARQVGYALHAMATAEPIPWHRVLNARGEISRRSVGDADELQRRLLEAEGVRFDAGGRVDLARFQWRPRVPAPRGRTPRRTPNAPRD